MVSLETYFPRRKHTLFVAAHVDEKGGIAGAVRDVAAAKDAGADGAIVINHGVPYTAVLEAYKQARIDNPSFLIGVNFLDVPAYEALLVAPRDANCLWFDDSRIGEAPPDQRQQDDSYLQIVWRRKEEHRPELLLMPCVAMKGIDPTEDLEKVHYQAQVAAPHADIVFTSGKHTGSAPSLPKLQAAVKGAGRVAVGNCSGTSAENVSAQKEVGVRAFIVSTSISNQEGRIDTTLAGSLAEKIHA